VNILQLVLLAVAGYLWGSIPAGYWMGQLLRGKNFDIRDYGSHKMGATNVLRTLGRWPAAIVLCFDLSKGVLPTLPGLYLPVFSLGGWGPVVAGMAALLGHCFPIFIGFKGGRGVMTGSGVILLLSPLTFVLCTLTAGSTIAIWRYVSLGSIIGALTAMICGVLWFVLGQLDPHFFASVSFPTLLYLVIGPLLIILFHYDNIKRLLAGNESKVGQRVQLDKSETSSAQA
jgi:glycerol-3-phosphate acyltransferase PlsY